MSGTCHQVDVTHTHHVMTFDGKTQPSNVMLEAHQHPLYCHVVYVCSKTSVEVQLPILFFYFSFFFDIFYHLFCISNLVLILLITTCFVFFFLILL